MAYDLQKLRVMVENATDLTSVARDLAERDRDYYDGHQWTTQEAAELNARKQPVITINRIKRKVDAMVGIENQGRVDPRAYPRRPDQEEAADIATKALVFIDDLTRFDSKRSGAFENLLVEGYGGVEVIVEERRGQLEVAVNRLRWEEIFFDPHSREKDFSDAAYVGCMKWMSLDAAIEMYTGVSKPDGTQWAAQELETLFSQHMKNPQDGETYDDRPLENSSFRWADKRQMRVRVAQMYYRHEGKWHLAIFSGGGEILNQVSPYLDEDDKPCCPIYLMSAYVDRENRRYGVVRDMISAQDEVNHRRSKALFQMTQRQTLGVKGAVDSVAKMKRELSRPDGHVEINIEQFEDAARVGMRPFEIVQNQDQTQGHLLLLQEAKTEIDMVGPNASLLGQLSGDQSGRAIQAQQQAGFAELAPIYDSLRDWTIRVYRAMWARVRQYWTEERWVRITQEGEKPQFVGLNVPQGMQVQMTPQGPMIAPVIANRPAEMDVDIIIEDVPDYATLKQEEFEQLAQLAQQGLPIPPEMLIQASSVRNKSQILEAMKAQQEAAAQQQMQAMQMQMQLEGMKAEGGFAKDQATAQKAMADAEQTQVETMRLMRTPIVVRPAAGA
jgi:hypothetical protein